MKKTIVIVLTSLTLLSNAQIPSYELQPYPRAIPNEGKPVARSYLGESRVNYSKRVHRVIDARMKQNKVLAWPRNPLSLVLWTAVTQGYADMPKPVAYANDSLVTEISVSTIKQKAEDTVRVWVPNPDNPNDPYDLIQVSVVEVFEYTKIVKFHVMEDWIFDVQRGHMVPRIIAIAPMYPMISQSGVDLGEVELFWVKLEDILPILAQQEIFNTKNDAARMSYDHWFDKRLFASTIVKESNMYDLAIKYMPEYQDDGVGVLLEADRIKNDLFIMEHDVWEY
jgi:gliding motility associated protien GldN